MANNDCAFGKVTRQMVTDIKENQNEVKVKLTALEERVGQAFNHMSNRLPVWATVMITLLTSLSVGLIVRVLS